MIAFSCFSSTFSLDGLQKLLPLCPYSIFPMPCHLRSVGVCIPRWNLLSWVYFCWSGTSSVVTGWYPDLFCRDWPLLPFFLSINGVILSFTTAVKQGDVICGHVTGCCLDFERRVIFGSVPSIDLWFLCQKAKWWPVSLMMAAACLLSLCSASLAGSGLFT